MRRFGGRWHIIGVSCDPRPLVYHHHRRQQPEEVARLMEGYDFGRGAYYAKGLFARRSWSIFLWPVIRHALANLSLGEFGAMKREWLGAWRYFRR